MSASGSAPRGTNAGNAPRESSDSESFAPHWIDEVLERAGDHDRAALPVVPDAATNPTQQLPAANRPITDELAQISWAESPQVRPAAEPLHSSSGAAVIGTQSGGLTPQAVGRSAWDDDLRSVGQAEPAGWEQLSWSDLDGNDNGSAREIAEPNAFARAAREWGPVLIAAVVIALFTRLVLVQAYHIPSLSMAPTLDDGDRVIVNRLSYGFGEIERGQVVVFSKPPNQPSDANDLIKRVIGLPGETLEFRDGNIYVDGLLVNEPYLSQQNSTRTRSLSIPGCAQESPSPETCQVPVGFVFVMGDNRVNSTDSRVFGPIPQDTIVGRAFVRVWPLDTVGRL